MPIKPDLKPDDPAINVYRSNLRLISQESFIESLRKAVFQENPDQDIAYLLGFMLDLLNEQWHREGEESFSRKILLSKLDRLAWLLEESAQQTYIIHHKKPNSVASQQAFTIFEQMLNFFSTILPSSPSLSNTRTLHYLKIFAKLTSLDSEAISSQALEYFLTFMSQSLPQYKQLLIQQGLETLLHKIYDIQDIVNDPYFSLDSTEELEKQNKRIHLLLSFYLPLPFPLTYAGCKLFLKEIFPFTVIRVDRRTNTITADLNPILELMRHFSLRLSSLPFDSKETFIINAATLLLNFDSEDFNKLKKLIMYIVAQPETSIPWSKNDLPLKILKEAFEQINETCSNPHLWTFINSLPLKIQLEIIQTCPLKSLASSNMIYYRKGIQSLLDNSLLWEALSISLPSINQEIFVLSTPPFLRDGLFKTPAPQKTTLQHYFLAQIHEASPEHLHHYLALLTTMLTANIEIQKTSTLSPSTRTQLGDQMTDLVSSKNLSLERAIKDSIQKWNIYSTRNLTHDNGDEDGYTTSSSCSHSSLPSPTASLSSIQEEEEPKASALDLSCV